MRRRIVLGGVIACGALSLSVAAFQQPPKPAASAIKVEKLSDNLYVLNALAAGAGGNTSVFVTNNGVILIDTKNPGWGQPLIEKVKTLTDKPITMIINTHTHGDHVSGNVEFPATVDVVAQENTKANMAEMRPASFVQPPPSGPAPNIFKANQNRNLPKKTFKDQMTIGSGNERIELHYFGRAHTNGDAMVLFPAAKVLHMADVFPNKGLPGADANNGGSTVEYAATLTKAADFADKAGVEKIVNGHNETTTTRADLREYIEYVKEFVKTVQDAKKAGKTPEQVAKEWKTPARFKGYEAMPNVFRVQKVAELVFKETK